MAIEDTINSIENHLQADYKALENIGADLTGVNKNIENIAQCVNEIYDNAPKTSYGEGTNISLANTNKGKLDYDKTILTGKNLIDFSQFELTSTSRGTISTTTSSITINLTGQFMAYVTSIPISNKTYALSVGSISGSTVARIEYRVYKNGTQIGSTATTTSNATIDNTSGNYDEIKISLSNATTTNTNITFTHLQMEVGSSATSYEPYTGGQKVIYDNLLYGDTEQDTLTGKNKFEPTLSINGTSIIQQRCTVTLNEDEFTFVATGSDMYFGNVVASGSNYAEHNGVLIEIPSGTTKVYITTTNPDIFNANYYNFYDNDKVSLGYGRAYATGTDVPSGSKYLSARIGYASSVSGTTYKCKVLVTFGNNDLTYEQYCGRNSKSKS